MGAGSNPAGIGPAGHDPVVPGSSSTAAAPATATLFDGESKDFVLLADGRWQALHWVDQAVAISVLFRQGTIAGSPDTGSTLHEMKYLGGKGEAAEVKDRVLTSNPLARLISEGRVAVKNILHETTSSGRKVVVEYWNLDLDPRRAELRRREAVY